MYEPSVMNCELGNIKIVTDPSSHGSVLSTLFCSLVKYLMTQSCQVVLHSLGGGVVVKAASLESRDVLFRPPL